MDNTSKIQKAAKAMRAYAERNELFSARYAETIPWFLLAKAGLDAAKALEVAPHDNY